MGLFTNWAMNRGLSLTESALRSVLGVSSFEAMVSEKIDTINQKLDILIGAPFRQAKFHLIEGSIEKSKDKLIEAMSLNELDLPAAALYTILLFKSGNVSLALDYSELLIRKFGPHGELVSKELIDVYKSHIRETRPLQAVNR